MFCANKCRVAEVSDNCEGRAAAGASVPAQLSTSRNLDFKWGVERWEGKRGCGDRNRARRTEQGCPGSRPSTLVAAEKNVHKYPAILRRVDENATRREALSARYHRPPRASRDKGTSSLPQYKLTSKTRTLQN
ncbi:hypothetical protein ACJJTC_004359 [Scirpophaga incertulas]